eukprot:9500920-Pyramimonas_sp.AAC.2
MNKTDRQQNCRIRAIGTMHTVDLLTHVSIWLLLPHPELCTHVQLEDAPGADGKKNKTKRMVVGCSTYKNAGLSCRLTVPRASTSC